MQRHNCTLPFTAIVTVTAQMLPTHCTAKQPNEVASQQKAAEDHTEQSCRLRCAAFFAQMDISTDSVQQRYMVT